VIAVRGTTFRRGVKRRGVREIDVFDGLVEVGSGMPGIRTREPRSYPRRHRKTSEATAQPVKIDTVLICRWIAQEEFSREYAAQAGFERDSVSAQIQNPAKPSVKAESRTGKTLAFKLSIPESSCRR